MTFPTNSAFNQPQPIPEVKVTPKQVVATAKVGVTTIYTSDLEDLEHDLRELSFKAGSPMDAQLFESIADKVASFYKG